MEGGEGTGRKGRRKNEKNADLLDIGVTAEDAQLTMLDGVTMHVGQDPATNRQSCEKTVAGSCPTKNWFLVKELLPREAAIATAFVTYPFS